MQLNKLFDETITKIEEIIKPHKQKVEQEIGDYEHPARITKILGEEEKNVHKLDREKRLLMFHEKRLTKIKEVRDEVINPDIKPLEEELNRTEEESSIYQEKDIEVLMHYFNNYRNYLKQSVNLLNGDKYDSNLGDTNERKHPSMNSLKNMESILERDRFHELRENNVHKFLTACGVLKRLDRSLQGYADVNEKDIEESEEVSRMIDSLIEEMRCRAEDLDLMLLKASSIFEAGEKHKDKTDWIEREDIPDDRPNTSYEK